MKSASRLLKNTLMLAASTILLRLCALCFQAYLAGKVGAEQLGVFGIVSSVGVVFATIAISGVRFSVTRLVSEEESLGNENPHSLMRSAYIYALFFGGISAVAMYYGSKALSSYWVMNETAKIPLRIMAVSMPLISIGAVAQGYFTAKQKIFRLVFTEVLAQLLRIFYVVLSFYLKRTDVITVLASGMLVSEAVLSVGMISLYLLDTVGKKESSPKKNCFPVLIKTALPLAVSAYMRTGLSSLGQVIIPRGLRKSGMGSSSAFSMYGVITQMSFPVIMFPAALLNALGEILVPRLTAAQVSGQKNGISYITNRALRLGVIFSFGVAGAMLAFSKMLGYGIYDSKDAGMYIAVFAPIIPIIYVDCVTDGCLKGLNQQVHSMVYNIWEGIINVVMLYILLPRTAIFGYIIVMYIKEVFNAILSLRRLSKVTRVNFSGFGVFAAVISAWGAQAVCKISFPGLTLWKMLTVYGMFYTAFLYVISAISRDDIKWLMSLICEKNISKKPPSVLTKPLSRDKII